MFKRRWTFFCPSKTMPPKALAKEECFLNHWFWMIWAYRQYPEGATTKVRFVSENSPKGPRCTGHSFQKGKRCGELESSFYFERINGCNVFVKDVERWKGKPCVEPISITLQNIYPEGRCSCGRSRNVSWARDVTIKQIKFDNRVRLSLYVSGLSFRLGLQNRMKIDNVRVKQASAVPSVRSIGARS